MSMMDSLMEAKVPHWTCPDCQTVYFGVGGTMRFCPKCREEVERKEAEYWDRVKMEQRVYASSIVAKYLGHKADVAAGDK